MMDESKRRHYLGASMLGRSILSVEDEAARASWLLWATPRSRTHGCATS
jgi:hypothetical protein